MLPAQRRHVLQEIFINGFAVIPDRLNCPFQIDGVPEHDGGCHQIEAGGAIALVFKTAIAQLAEPIEEDGSSQRVAGLALVQSGLDAAPQLDVLQPIQGKEAPLDPAQLA